MKTTSFFLKSPLDNETHDFCSHVIGENISYNLNENGAVKCRTWLNSHLSMATLLYERKSINNYWMAVSVVY